MPDQTRWTVTVLGERVDLKAGVFRLGSHFQPFLWLLALTALLDALSTMAFMSTLGAGHEQNPFVRLLSYQFGIVAGPMLGKLTQLFAAATLAVLTPRLARLVLTTAILLNLFAFVVNMHVFGLSTPGW